MKGLWWAIALMGTGASGAGYLGLRSLSAAFMPGIMP